MKSYTDLEQSHKLAEFLPLESADMYYYSYMSLGELFYMNCPDVIEEGQKLAEKDIPCWSLVALLSVIKPVKENTYKLMGTLDGGAIISFYEVTNVMYQEEEIIDAVYEMVLWLHEKGVL